MSGIHFVKLIFPAGLLLLQVELFAKSGGNEIKKIIKNGFWPAFIEFQHYYSYIFFISLPLYAIITNKMCISSDIIFPGYSIFWQMEGAVKK